MGEASSPSPPRRRAPDNPDTTSPAVVVVLDLELVRLSIDALSQQLVGFTLTTVAAEHADLADLVCQALGLPPASVLASASQWGMRVPRAAKLVALALHPAQGDPAPGLTAIATVHELRTLGIAVAQVTPDLLSRATNAAVAVANAALTMPALIDALAAEQRSRLADAVDAVAREIRTDDLEHHDASPTGGPADGTSLATVAVLTDLVRTLRLPAGGADTVTDLLAEFTPPPFEGVPGAMPINEPWIVVGDLPSAPAPEIGHLTFAPVKVEVQSPSMLFVRTPLRGGSDASLASGMSARVLDLKGRLVAEGTMKVSLSNPSELPVMWCGISVPQGFADERALHVEVASRGTPLPTAAQIKETFRDHARDKERSGLCAERDDRPADSSRFFEAAGQIYAVIGDDAAASAAFDRAGVLRRERNGSVRGEAGSADEAASWFGPLVWTARVLTRRATRVTPDDPDELAQLLTALEATIPEFVPFLNAYTRELRESGDLDAARRVGDEALKRAYRTGDEHGAARAWANHVAEEYEE